MVYTIKEGVHEENQPETDQRYEQRLLTLLLLFNEPNLKNVEGLLC